MTTHLIIEEVERTGKVTTWMIVALVLEGLALMAGLVAAVCGALAI